MTALASTTTPALPSQQVSLSQRSALLRPWPRVTGRMVLGLVGIVLLYAWGIAGSDVNPGELAKGVPNIVNFIVRLMPPAWKLTEVSVATPAIALGAVTIPSVGVPGLKVMLPEVLFAIIETVQMALIGTTLAVILSFPFGLLAARNTSPHRWVYLGTRLLLNVNRAVPEIIFALIFVAAVGLGPFSGVLALALGAIGVMGKLYAEAIEAIDPQQVLAVSATGANRLQTFVYGVVPQAAPLVASYSLLLFENNVRHATILGIVGAGGVGFVLSKYMALFQYQNLMGAMLLIIVCVTIIDRLSDALRKRMI